MFKSLRIIAGDLGPIIKTILLNILHLMLKGFPYGLLFFVIMELLKPKAQIDVKTILWMFVVMGAVMIINIFIAIKVHVDGYINSYNLTTDARLRLGDHLRKLSLGFFKKRDPGDISSLLLQDMSKVESIFSHFFIDATACIVLPGVMASFLFIADFKLTAFMVAVACVSVPTLLFGQKLITYFGRKHMETRNKVASRLLEYLQGIKVLMAFNLTGRDFKRLDDVMKKFSIDSIKLEAAGGAPVMTYLLLLEFGFIGLMLLGGYFFDLGGMELPVFLLFLVIGYKFFEPLVNFGIFTSEMKYMALAAKRITDVVETKPLSECADPRVPTEFNIEFEDVSFGYTDKTVLKNINADFAENSITALVGPSGSGKTTLTSLIARFWDVGSGSIKIGGNDIREISYENLNSMLSVVFQDVYLFQDTIYNNIKVGKKDATKEEIIEAAKKANCHDFIMDLDDGYETMAGEGGARLSGGEKQRISIARALLKDAPIVLLDEATASLDPENELLIQKAISEMVKNKTLIIIAHRLKTIANANQILVLDNGEISECGVHKDLVEKNGLYKRLWDEQQKSGGWKFREKKLENSLAAH